MNAETNIKEGKTVKIVESILTANPCYKAGKKINVKGLMLHSVGCPQPSAETFVKKWNNAESSRACVHAFIDGNTAVVYQTLPWDHRAWHCGGDANGTHIGVEMCEPACIKYTGGSSFTCTDKEAAMAVVKRTYDAAVELFAYLCKQYGLNPLQDGVIISHKEGHDRGVASGHGDPDHLWKGLGCEYTMDGFRQAVAAAMQMEGTAAPEAAEQKSVATPAATEQKSVAAPAASAAANGQSIRENDVVTLAAGAVYYDGKAMPGWVRSDKWIVKSIQGDRAILGKNVSGTHNISSPVNVKYLTCETAHTTEKSSAAPATEKKAETTGKQPTAAASAEMTISDAGVELIAKYEGCQLNAYKCPAGVWTIGYGHTAGVKAGDTLPSKEKAKALLKEDLKKYGGYVNDYAKKGVIGFSMNQNQFDALTSFCYNCGQGSLKNLVTGRDAQTVADKLLAYVKGGGKVLPGLVRRREEERELFLKRG
jgi:GH24 family phage-related lysozyme (muramidase)